MDPQQQQAQQLVHQFLGLYVGFILVAFIVKVALYVIPLWRIATKAGKPGALSLLCAIPIVGRLITLYVLAFSEWTPPVTQGYGLPPGGYAPPAFPSPYQSQPVYPPSDPPPPTQL